MRLIHLFLYFIILFHWLSIGYSQVVKVEVCDHELYDNAMCIVEQPIISSTYTTLQFDFNQGKLTPGDAWLFITNADSVRNESGYNIPIKQESTPVELASFHADLVDDGVLLTRKTKSESNNLGFEIQRKSDGEDFRKIGFIKGSGTTLERSTYQYKDKYIQPGRYTYRLKQLDHDGYFTYSACHTVTVAIPRKYYCLQNYPNPFSAEGRSASGGNPTTTITLAIPKSGNVIGKTYNLKGQEVKTLIDRTVNAGEHILQWDGKNHSRNKVGSGVYFFKLRCGNFTKTLRMVLTL